MEHAVPILPSRDLGETLALYAALGFESLGEEGWEYLILGRGTVRLHFTHQPDVDPLSSAGSCYVYVEDADAVYRVWEPLVQPDPATGSRIVAPRSTEHGMRELAVVDRSGNLLRIGSPLDAGGAG
ncbi:bleomycin resistance protein [Georgenia sp. Marseille-Q6866]